MGEIAAEDSVGAAMRRMVVKVLSVGALAALAGLGANGAAGAFGAFGGAAAAGLYVLGYVRSHVNRRVTERTFDSRVARFALIRVLVIALVGIVVFAVWDKPALKAYLLSFLCCFPILLASEAPRAARQLKARGIIG
ncbi:MAG: hypothetical protein ACT4OM_09800 [Actinomycetota bacterium]